MTLLVIGWITWFIIGSIVALLTNVLTRNRHDSLDTVISAILGAFIGGFLASQFGITGVIDFSLLSIPAALVGAIIFVILLRRFTRRQVKSIAPVYPAQLDELMQPTAEYARAHEPTTSMARRRINRSLFIGAIILLPVLDAMLMRVRLPDISVTPPPFGAVATYQNEAGQLDYLVYTPAQYQSGTATPLLVLLHGCMQDPYILEAASGMRTLADANNFLLVYPQQNYLSSPHRCWNWYDKRNQHRGSGEPSLITGIVTQVQQEYSVDAERIYVAGISSGGAMTSVLASCYPDLFAAAAVHSGMAYESANSIFQAFIAPLQGNQVPPDIAGRDAYQCSGTENALIPILVLHGTTDSIVVPINGEHTLEQFAQTNDFADDGNDNNSVRAEATNTTTGQVENGYTYTIEDFDYGSDRLMQRYTVDGLWHMWSGGTGVYPLSDPKGPNASEIIWDFFSAYRL
jgi:poly(hydroxyalkanoate) depolymerase family esterase